MNYGMDCLYGMVIRRKMRRLISEENSEINLEKMWSLVEFFDNEVLLGSETEA